MSFAIANELEVALVTRSTRRSGAAGTTTEPLHVHHATVRRTTSQTGDPFEAAPQRASLLEPVAPFVAEPLDESAAIDFGSRKSARLLHQQIVRNAGGQAAEDKPQRRIRQAGVERPAAMPLRQAQGSFGAVPIALKNHPVVARTECSRRH